jgi:hypothetical protein
VTCAPTSGGHFNPAITLCFAFWKGFPWWKVPHYIFAQITGAFLAALCVMVQYRQQIQIFKAESLARGHGVVYAGGPASILVTLPGRMETHLGILFMTEWIADTYVVRLLSLGVLESGALINCARLSSHGPPSTPRIPFRLSFRLPLPLDWHTQGKSVSHISYSHTTTLYNAHHEQYHEN